MYGSHGAMCVICIHSVSISFLCYLNSNGHFVAWVSFKASEISLADLCSDWQKLDFDWPVLLNSEKYAIAIPWFSASLEKSPWVWKNILQDAIITFDNGIRSLSSETTFSFRRYHCSETVLQYRIFDAWRCINVHEAKKNPVHFYSWIASRCLIIFICHQSTANICCPEWNTLPVKS